MRNELKAGLWTAGIVIGGALLGRLLTTTAGVAIVAATVLLLLGAGLYAFVLADLRRDA